MPATPPLAWRVGWGGGSTHPPTNRPTHRLTHPLTHLPTCIHTGIDADGFGFGRCQNLPDLRPQVLPSALGAAFGDPVSLLALEVWAGNEVCVCVCVCALFPSGSRQKQGARYFFVVPLLLVLFFFKGSRRDTQVHFHRCSSLELNSNV